MFYAIIFSAKINIQMMKMKRTATLKLLWETVPEKYLIGKEYKFFKGKNQRVRIFKLIFVCMHHLIESMRKCLREAISNDGVFIYYLQFLLLYCLMPVFCIKIFLFPLFFPLFCN